MEVGKQMNRNILLVTVGTVAARVGRKIQEQIEAHPASKLNMLFRHIDTAYLPGREPGIRPHEWFHLHMDPLVLQSAIKIFPRLEKLLYPNLLPEISGFNSSGVRYNAAAAAVLNADALKRWLGVEISNLIRSTGIANISMAVIISAIGGTGSGSLEHILGILSDAAADANLPEPFQINVFVLQPARHAVDNHGLANAFALFAEMAASRLLMLNDFPRYRGRIIMVGWGGRYSLVSIEQLQEAAATLVRITSDPVLDIAAEFEEREIDNHVLRHHEDLMGLPPHLTTATALTITMGNLKEQVIQRDVARLIDGLAFGGVTSASDQDNPLENACASLLGGDTSQSRYHYLLGHLLTKVRLASLNMTEEKMKTLPTSQLAHRLGDLWRTDSSHIEENRSAMAAQFDILVKDIISRLLRLQRDLLVTGSTLQHLRQTYRAFRQMLTAVLAVAREDQQTVVIDDKATSMAIDALNKSTRLNRKKLLKHALQAIQTNIRAQLRKHIHPYAINVLDELLSHCEQSISWLETELEQWQLKHRQHPEWAEDRPFDVESGHPLQLIALRSEQETKVYAELLSIFTPRVLGNGDIDLADTAQNDVLASFRRRFHDSGPKDATLLGTPYLNHALNIAQDFVREHIEERSIIDILQQVSAKVGRNVLQSRLTEALDRFCSSVKYSPGLAEDRREGRLVSAYYNDDQQRFLILEAIEQSYGIRTKLCRSQDPTEVCVFYYVDGLSMAAVSDLNGRCFRAFREEYQGNLNKKQSQVPEPGNRLEDAQTERANAPLFSGLDAEQRVHNSGVIDRLNEAFAPGADSQYSTLSGDDGLERKNSP